MNKSELVDAIADRTGVSKSDVDSTLKGLFEVVAQTVSKDSAFSDPPATEVACFRVIADPVTVVALRPVMTTVTLSAPFRLT